MRDSKRRLVSWLLTPALVLACLAGLVPGDVACCAGWMPLHGPDCCAGSDAESRRCCEGEDGLQRADRSVTVSILASAFFSTPVSPSATLSPGSEPASAPGFVETVSTPLYRLHASLLL